MSNPIFRAERTPSSRSRRRRPQGVSRRQRKQLGFEVLEDRRVMSAQSPLATFQGGVGDDVQLNVQSYSSSTSGGQTQILLNELAWQALASSSNRGTVQATALPTDPYLNNQWHLINTGQEVGNPDFQDIFAVPGEDINFAPVFNNTGYTGAGVNVAVVDSGVQVLHPDLMDNISTTLGFNTFSGTQGPSSNLGDPHGTAVAGLIAAVANNDEGGSGVAPGATIVPIDFLDSFGLGNPDPNATVNLFRYAIDEIDITNNSWGPRFDTDADGTPDRGIARLSQAEALALRDSILFGRKVSPEDERGLGVIHVFAAGNDAGSPFDPGFQSLGNHDSASYNGWVNSRYTIGVTGVDHDGFYNNIDGTITSFAEAGTSVLVAAPTGSAPEAGTQLNIGDDTGIGSGIFTTDVTGEGGYNISPDPVTGQEFDRDFFPDLDYTTRFGGTSAAAPIVSGVIALMLEANPNLSYRDVQEILLRSARQNAEFAVPSTVAAGSTQNTWIQNQMPVFHDPDAFDPTISPVDQTFFPTLDPNISRVPTGPTAVLSGGLDENHFQATPQTLTNGAGYTVSQGRGAYGEEIGFAHGVVDAEMAVKLAEQWTTKNQSLPDELTFTSFVTPGGGFFIPLPAREIGSEDSGFQYVPGGLGGQPGFISYWNEFFVDDPFANFTFTGRRGGYVNLTVPDNNLMSVENVEVKITGTGGEGQFLDHVRVLLVSPTGTHHDLNPFFVEQVPNFSLMNATPATAFDSTPGDIPGSVATDGDDNSILVTFNSNRSWGERSDDALIFDPLTNEPYAGTPDQAWQLHFENYSGTAFEITGIEVNWHGSPIDESGGNTQRVQGLIGVDENRDDAFDYGRVTTLNSDVDGVVRFGEVVNTINLDHESMGENVTVFAHRDANANGILDAPDVLVDQFVTGADGNYYFDLAPNFYIFSIEDGEGRTPVDDTLTPPNFLKDFQSQWAISPDYFKVWDYDANLEVPLNALTDAPFSFSGTDIPYHVSNINFLLDPGPPAAQEVNFSGAVIADINGDGIFNGADVAVPGVGVFGDVNRNGELDGGEILVTTDANGQYDLTIPTTSINVINVGVRPPANWTLTDNPEEGFKAFFVEPGMVISGEDFFIQPPAATASGDGSVSSGIILGSAFNDTNGDGARQTNEVGVPNQTIYIDNNNSGQIDAGDIVTTTNSNGAYAFAGIPDGNHFVRIAFADDSVLSQTFPILDLPQVAVIESGGTAVATNFGVSSGVAGGVFDFGDLPDVYGTRLSDNGPRHPEGLFFLGNSVDAEQDGLPSTDALGDDTEFLPDEDGVVLVDGTLTPGTTGTLTVTASRHSGFLQGWIDYNNDGDFNDTIDGVSERLFENQLLVTGPNTLTFDIPATLTGTTFYARFRYGEHGLGLFGAAQVGEVEDYQFTTTSGPTTPVTVNGPDFDADGDVDGNDLLAWMRGYGMENNATASQGDANSDNAVTRLDLALLKLDFGQGSVQTPEATADFDSDGDVDGADFLALQRGLGKTGVSFSDGDSNQDGRVDSADFQVWKNTMGGGSVAQLAAATSSSSGSSDSSGTFTSQYTAALATSSTPPMIQPYFPEVYVPEDVGAGVVDASEQNRAIDPRGFASLASETQRLAALADTGEIPAARLERNVESSDAGSAELQSRLDASNRDEVMKDLFRDSDPAEEELFDDSTAEDALAIALGEQINWRLG